MDSVHACRYIIQHMINEWNEESNRLSNFLRMIKKSQVNGSNPQHIIPVTVSSAHVDTIAVGFKFI